MDKIDKTNKKITQKLAYVQFLLYLCSRFGKDHAFGR